MNLFLLTCDKRRVRNQLILQLFTHYIYPSAVSPKYNMYINFILSEENYWTIDSDLKKADILEMLCL